jgi:hypothetical protein
LPLEREGSGRVTAKDRTDSKKKDIGRFWMRGGRKKWWIKVSVFVSVKVNRSDVRTVVGCHEK